MSVRPLPGSGGRWSRGFPVPKREREGRRDGPSPRPLALDPAPAADVYGAGLLLERAKAGRDVTRRHLGVPVEAQDHLAAGRGEGGVQPGRRVAARVVDDDRAGGAGQVGRVVRRPPVSDDHLEASRDLLREDRPYARDDARGLVSRRDDHRDVRPPGGVRGYRSGSQRAPLKHALVGAGVSSGTVDVQGFRLHRPGSRRARRLAYGVAAVLLAAGWVAAPGASGRADSEQRESRLVWTGNYESGDFSQWEDVLRETIAGGARIVAKPVAQGRYAARFELGPQSTYE